MRMIKLAAMPLLCQWVWFIVDLNAVMCSFIISGILGTTAAAAADPSPRLSLSSTAAHSPYTDWSMLIRHTCKEREKIEMDEIKRFGEGCPRYPISFWIAFAYRRANMTGGQGNLVALRCTLCRPGLFVCAWFFGGSKEQLPVGYFEYPESIHGRLIPVAFGIAKPYFAAKCQCIVMNVIETTCGVILIISCRCCSLYHYFICPVTLVAGSYLVLFTLESTKRYCVFKKKHWQRLSQSGQPTQGLVVGEKCGHALRACSCTRVLRGPSGAMPTRARGFLI